MSGCLARRGDIRLLGVGLGMLLTSTLVSGCKKPAETDTDEPPTETDTDTDTDGLVHDPLSMPAEPTVDPARFTSAQLCESCHEDHYEEWSSSMHAYAMVDPVFQAMVEIRQEDLGNREDQFCTSCHSSIGTRGGECVSGFEFDDLSPIVLEGITCEACHKVSEVVRPYNAGHRLDPDGPMRGPTGAEGPIHDSEAFPVIEDSAFCATCHDVVETSGLPLERPYGEWTESPAAEDGRTCQSCHMPEQDDGRHEHRWVGVDLPMVEGFVDDETRTLLQGRIQALLESSASVELQVTDATPAGLATALVTVENHIDGHNFPTGSTFLRQVWVELVVEADGVPIYTSGTLDANGDLRDHWSALDPYGDQDLMTLSSTFTDDAGSPTLFSWRATEHTSYALSPLYSRSWSAFVDIPVGASEITAVARLRFRPLPPHLLRELGLSDEADAMPIYDVDTASWAVQFPE